MGRAKLKMELITNKKTRNTTYHKRKQGIIKKANEFTILCDVNTSIIIFPPDSKVAEIWPENKEKMNKNIAAYKAKKYETGKISYDLHDFFEDRKKKIEDALVKARKKNMEAKYPTWFDELDGLNEGKLRQFAMELENKENVVRAHLEFRKKNMKFQLPNVDYYQGLVDLDDGQVMMNHDGGWFSDALGMGFGCYNPEFDGGMGYDNPSQWGFPAAEVHGDVTPELVKQEYESQVNVNGVGEFVMDDDVGWFNMGSF